MSAAYRLATIVVVLTFVMAGCSRAPFDTAPVEGTVTIDGQPLKGGKVVFAPIAEEGSAESGKSAIGPIQSDGTYSLTTYSSGDGAVVADHWVTVLIPEQAVVPNGDPKKFKRLTMREKKIVAGDQNNVIDLLITKQEIARLN